MSENEPIVVVQSFGAPIKRVWNAITDLEQMRLWYFPNIPEFKAEIGFETQFLIQNEGRNFTHIWRVKEIIPQKLIGYSWTFEEYEGEGYSVFKLSEKDNRTILTLENEVLKAFPDDIPEFKRESGVAGWRYLINQNLVNFLAS